MDFFSLLQYFLITVSLLPTPPSFPCVSLERISFQEKTKITKYSIKRHNSTYHIEVGQGKPTEGKGPTKRHKNQRASSSHTILPQKLPQNTKRKVLTHRRTGAGSCYLEGESDNVYRTLVKALVSGKWPQFFLRGQSFHLLFTGLQLTFLE